MQIPPLYTSALGAGGNSNYASSQTAAESAKFSQILNELKNKTEGALNPKEAEALKAAKAAEKRDKDLKKACEALKTESHTVILYEAPHRLKKTLAALHEALGDARRIVLCRELTKVHEEYERVSLGEALKLYEEKEPRGEYVLVLEGSTEEETESSLSIPEQMQELLERGMTEKDAMKETARILGISKREVYGAWKLT